MTNLKKIWQTSKRFTSFIPCVSFLAQNCMFLSCALYVPVITVICSAECSQQMKFSRQLNAVQFLHTTAQRSSSTTRIICQQCIRWLLCPPGARDCNTGSLYRGSAASSGPPVKSEEKYFCPLLIGIKQSQPKGRRWKHFLVYFSIISGANTRKEFESEEK